MPISAYTQCIDLSQSVFTPSMSRRLRHELNLVCLLWVASHWRLIWSIDWSKVAVAHQGHSIKPERVCPHVIRLEPQSSPLMDNGLYGRVLLSENEQVSGFDHKSKTWHWANAASEDISRNDRKTMMCRKKIQASISNIYLLAYPTPLKRK